MTELTTKERRTVKRVDGGGGKTRQYLTFTLNREVFAVCTEGVREIIEYRSLTAVPMVPDSIRGVINLRGAVVPVVDLGARFGSARTETGRRSCIVILDVEEGETQQVIGVLVDAVNEVLKIPASDIEPAPTFGAKIRTDFIQGMGKVGGNFVIILNVDKVLSVEELALVSKAAGLPEPAADGGEER